MLPPTSRKKGATGHGRRSITRMEHRYTIVLEARRSRDEAEALRQLKAGLKHLLRIFGLRAVSIAPSEPAQLAAEK